MGKFHPEAEKELILSAAWYEARQKELGHKFLLASHQAVAVICANPLQFPVIKGQTRRCVLTGFPFGILYRLHPDQIEIITVIHHHRDPDYWQHRI